LQLHLEALRELYHLGCLARRYGQSTDTFEDVRKEALELAAKCGEKVLHDYASRMSRCHSF
jgi:hypothetical protein